MQSRYSIFEKKWSLVYGMVLSQAALSLGVSVIGFYFLFVLWVVAGLLWVVVGCCGWCGLLWVYIVNIIQPSKALLTFLLLIFFLFSLQMLNNVV